MYALVNINLVQFICFDITKLYRFLYFSKSLFLYLYSDTELLGAEND